MDAVISSLVPRPSTPPAFDRFQYWKRSKAGGVEGLGTRLVISPLQMRVEGSGFQIPVTDSPSDVQFALILPAGTNPVSHMKNVLAPTSVPEIRTMEPFRGPVGISQLTGRK